MNASKNGLVLEADMGYGKSAFVAHTVCAGKNSQGHRLREMLVAFHLCKFDVILTKKPGVFIQRLASMISHFIPELMDTLKMDGQCFTHYLGELCNEDPLGCTDICLIHPLERLIARGFKPSAVKVILIDAIDECANYNDADDNAIFEVIRKKFHLFPNWIKVLMTSRRSKQNIRLLPDFDVIYLRSMDKRNLRDIQSYLNNTNVKILEQTASFIIAKHMVESNNFTEGNLRNLNRFYDDQFERIFGKEFVLARIILEVIATTFWTKTKRNIIEIITKISTVDERSLNNEFEKIGHFFIIENDTFSFNHHSVVEWLETTSPETYRIRRANGHKINAMYLLNVIATGRNIVIDIVDLAIHLMNSENHDESIDLFKNITLEQKTHIEMNFSESPLIRCVKRTDCSTIPIVLYFHFNNTEELSSENFTAAYIAAATGKLSALKGLCDHGADVNFRVKSYHGTKLANVHNAVQVAMIMKQWGYGLLDIAAQNGHAQIVNFILRDNTLFGNYSYHILNGINLKPVHLACKSGYVDTVKEFYIYNKGSVDWQCLYFASDGGHLSLVIYLVNKLNITDRCRKCNEDLTWIPSGCSRMHGRKVEIVSLFDDWGDLSCESALHAAVRGNYVNILRVIIARDSGRSLSCLDRGGRPPLLLAIQNCRKDIVKYILENHKQFAHIRYSCGNSTKINDKLKLNENEENLLCAQICKPGFRLVDVIAEQGDSWTFEEFNQHGIYLDFFTRDVSGCFPAHTAACSGNIRLLKHLIQDQKMDIMNLRCDNKSTPLHSAIICQSSISFDFILENVDSANTELHKFRFAYMWLAVNQTVFSLNHKKQPLSSIIITLFSILPDTVNASDHFGRNPVYYLIQNGHSDVLNKRFLTDRFSFDTLLTRTDYFEQTPIMFSVRRLVPRNTFAVLYEHLYLERDLHLSELPTDQRFLVQSEYTFIMVLQYANLRNLLTSSVKTRILGILIKKRLFYSFHFCLSHIVGERERYQTYVLNSVLENDSLGLFLAFYYRMFYFDIDKYFKQGIDIHKVKHTFPFLLCNSCKRLTKICLVHKMVHKAAQYENINSDIYDRFEKIEIKFMLNIIFKTVNGDVLTSCRNENGQNVLDVAIQQKSIMLTSYFLDKGVSPSFSHESVLSNAIKTSVFREGRQVSLYNSTDNDTALEFTVLKFVEILSI
ncbi:protein TANC2-like [Mya arenaria]|uniref:protein TANC2-like n=1 Tax=Mya arenaria TaxID=6604 RepID=UPI0022E2A5EF|nr:protein TANC2-like [Mya arenaria]